MATYRKRGQRWRVEVMRNGERVSKTFDTKAQAAAWASDFTSGHAGANRTLDEALSRYAREVTPTKRGRHWEAIRLKAFRERLPFAHRRIADVTPDLIGKWRDARLAAGLKPATVTRELILLSSVFQTARIEWRWVSSNPVREVRKPAGSKPRKRIISADEVDVLCAALGYQGGSPKTASERVAVALLVALETAMRAGELCSLTAADMHLAQRYVHLDMTKNGEERDIPLSAEALRLLKLVPDGFGLDARVLDTLFRRARDTAAQNYPDLASVHFHDSRRTATIALAKKLDVMTLAKMTGHKDLKILMSTYYQINASEVADRL